MLRFSPTRMAVITLAMLFAIVTGVAFAFTGGERLFWARDQRELQSLDKTRALGLNSSRDWQLKGGHLVPSATAALDLGSSSLKWRDGYFSRNLSVAGTITSGGLDTTYLPSADNTDDLGAADKQWANLYVAQSIYGAGNEYTFPAAGGVFTTTAGTQTLTNKTLTSPVLTAPTATTLTASDNITISAAGKGLKIKEGSNAKMGTATLSSGVATVSTTAVGATSRVFVTGQSTTGATYTGNRVNGTSFAIYSTDNADSGDAAWVIIEPAP